MKKSLMIILTAVAIVTLSMTNANALSLKLKKEKAKAQEAIEQTAKTINTKCGCTPKVDVKWDTLTTKDDFKIPNKMLSGAADGMGRMCKNYKKEVCKGIKTIVISKSAKMNKSLKNGVMEISTTVYNRYWGGQNIQKLIENNLE